MHLLSRSLSFLLPVLIGTASLSAQALNPDLLVASGDVTSTSAYLWSKHNGSSGESLSFALSTSEAGPFSPAGVVTSGDASVPVKAFVNGLTPDTEYFYRVEFAGEVSRVGRFVTPAESGLHGLSFGISGDWRGELTPYPAIANVPQANLDFFVQLGDTIYADDDSPASATFADPGQARSVAEFRAKHAEVYQEDSFGLGLNNWADLRASTSVFATIDDHEVTNDFAGYQTVASDGRFTTAFPGEIATFINESELYRNGLQVFQEFNPIAELVYSATGDSRTEGKPKLYRKQAYGKDAVLIVLDARSFRDAAIPAPSIMDSTNPTIVGGTYVATFDIDPTTGAPLPARKFLGDAQLADLKADLLEAQAAGITWKFVNIPEPIQEIFPGINTDTIAGYQRERTEILKFIEANKIKNVVFVAADVHTTWVNNLTYREAPFSAPGVFTDPIATSVWEITTGSVAYDRPTGEQLAGIAISILPEPQRAQTAAFYNNLPIAPSPGDLSGPGGTPTDKDDFVEAAINDQLIAPFGLDPIGLDHNLPQAEGLIRATLIEGDYFAGHTYGWTQFEIDSSTQLLTVTTYGMDAYTVDEIMTESSRSEVLSRPLNIVSKFTVEPARELLVTEINSNGTEDFWELTNVGNAAVDLSGWSWDDDSATPGVVPIPDGTILAPGEAIIFTGAPAAAFRSIWGLDPSVKIVSGGPGLGQNDGVFLFDDKDALVTSFTYAAAGFTKSDGSPSNGGHAGLSAGGASAAQSAIFDPTFGSASPRYTAADGVLYGTVLVGTGPEAGSPGESGLNVAPPAFELAVNISPASFSESAANPAAIGTVSRTGDTTGDLVVTLLSGDTTEASVPATVTILAGSASAAFDVTAIDDAFPDGDQTFSISATAADGIPGSVEITVNDDGDRFEQRLLLTEIQSNQSGTASAGASDYWELTNFGATAIDLAGYSWHDSGRDATIAANVSLLPSGSSIAPGESVIFTEASPADFRAWWGLGASVKVFQADAAQSGLGRNDGVSFFGPSGNEIFFFSYAAAGFLVEDGGGSLGDHAGFSAGGSDASQAAIWVPSSGFDSPRYTAATGANYGSFSAATGTDLGSPGSLGEVLDLSLYVRVGRFDLPEPSRTTAPANNLLAEEASAVTYNWDTDTLFITGDGGQSITQVSKTGVLIDTMTLALGSSPQGTDFYDPEGLTYIGNGEFVMSEERDRQLVKFTYVAGATLTRAQAQTVKLGTFDNNTGTEGVSFDPMTGGYIALKEKNPIGVFQTDVDFTTGTASNGSATAANSISLFDTSLLGMSDVADVFALSNLPVRYSGNLLVLGQEDGRVVNIDRSGNISSILNITSDVGNPLSVADQQHEGITMDREGRIYIVNENGGGDITRPQLWVYAAATGPNAAPTAVALNNELTSVPENAPTFSPFKIADIVVTDDGLGVNELSVTGADAAFFEIVNTSLFVKAGTVIDFETQTRYSINIEVDDTTVGNTPDAMVAFTLNVIDIEPETATGPSLLVTEAAPWASGNSPVGVDWFELTNNTNAPIDITGWKMDDNSASLGVAVDLVGVTTIAPGESVIFLQSTAANLAANATKFINEWFGGSAPANFKIGAYDGGPGLGTGGDGVFIFDDLGILVTSFSFGSSPTAAPFATFDNSAGVESSNLLSEIGTFGAFLASNGAEIGSPGTAGKIFITEVAPWSSGNSPLNADWFEITNLSGREIDLTGWKMDDNSESATTAVPLEGVTTIAPGESVIFIDTSSPAELATAAAAFRSLWFGDSSPAQLQIGSYSGPGLGTGGDAVSLFDGSNTRRARVIFGASPSGPAFATFDNLAGIENVAISQLSVAGTNGAFVAANDASETGSPGTVENPFKLELFHLADQEATAAAVGDAPRLSAVLNKLRDEDLGNDGLPDNSLTLSSGDAILAGLFYDASEPVYGSKGIADIQIQNELGIQAIAFGNHEFDFGTSIIAALINGSAVGNILGGDFTGTSFPYLSGNLDFTTDAAMSPLITPDHAAPVANKVAASTVIDVNGEKIGVVAATTPTLRSISSPGTLAVAPVPFGGVPSGSELDALAATIQQDVDALLLSDPSIDKVILLAHMQQISIEQALATRLKNVDIIVAGGSNTRLFDSNDRIRPGDNNQGPYPIISSDANGQPIAIVNTDGSYKYLGRLVIDFDAFGNIIPSSYDETISGAYATDEQGVIDLAAAAFVDPEIQTIADEIGAQIIASDRNFFGVTTEFLNGNRSGGPTDGVRTQETNLGNLTADANLAYAKAIDPDVVVSLKNGGGIRASIGETVVLPGTTTPSRIPPTGNPLSGRPAGGISENAVKSSLAFNNGLSLVTVTRSELVALLEHGVAATNATNAQGRFPQVAGVEFSFDIDLPAGDRVVSAAIVDNLGEPTDLLVVDGAIVGDPAEPFRMVTLNFLAAGGDGYPFPQGTGVNLVNLFTDVDNDNIADPISGTNPATGSATFAADGTEQDAFAEYLLANFPFAAPYQEADQDRSSDTRIQNLDFRMDEVLLGLDLATFAASYNIDPTDDSTILAYAFGLAPGVAAALVVDENGQVITRGTEAFSIEVAPNQVGLSLTFLRRKDAGAQGLNYIVQFSSDLNTWFNSAQAPAVLGLDGEMEVVRATLPIFTPGLEKSRFFRILVEAN